MMGEIWAAIAGWVTTGFVGYMVGRMHGFTHGIDRSWNFHKGLFEARLKDAAPKDESEEK